MKDAFVSEDGIGVDRYGEYFDLTADELRAHAAAIAVTADEVERHNCSPLHLAVGVTDTNQEKQ